MIDIEKMIHRKRVNFENEMTKLRAKYERYKLAHAQVRTLGLSGEVADMSEFNLSCGLTVEIQREELPLLREVFGRPEIAGKDVKDGAAGTINVFVTFEKLADTGIRFSYTKVLSAEQKCKIKTIHSSYQTLVCEAGS